MGEPLMEPVDVCDAIRRAKELVSEAISILDAARAPADLAAHLDLAMHRMEGALAT